MPPVFNRYHPSLLDAHLSGWEASQDYPRRAMAWNLRYDFRVFPHRAEQFSKGLAAPLTEPLDAALDKLELTLVKYQKQTVREAARPSFLEHNEENIVSAFQPRLLLGTVLDLSGLTHTMSEARRNKHPAFKRFRLEDQLSHAEGAWTAPAWNSFLQQHFLGKNDAGREEFLGDLFYAISKFPQHPVWVTSWDQLKPNLTVPRCLQLVGLPRRDHPRILIALRYPARDVGTLLRPSQLDAGFNPHHHPSPPSRPIKDGGAVMDLALPPGANGLVPEFIHSQIQFTVQHWRAANCWTGQTSAPVLCDLAEARRRHQGLLRTAHGVHNPPWMEEFPEE